MDISNPKEIWKFAEQFKNEHKLNVLVSSHASVMCLVLERLSSELIQRGVWISQPVLQFSASFSPNAAAEVSFLFALVRSQLTCTDLIIKEREREMQ